MVVIGDKSIKELVGTVVSVNMNKTIVIQVDAVKMHSLYKKRFVRAKRYYSHDENNSAGLGDTVRIRQDRPRSKLKRRDLVEIVKKSLG